MTIYSPSAVHLIAVIQAVKFTIANLNKAMSCKSGPVDKFIVPDWEKSWLRHLVVIPARQATYAGKPMRQPYAGVNYTRQSGTMNFATGI